MDEALQKPEPKISQVEIVIFLILFVICDLLELIPFAGDFLDILVGAPFDLYCFFRGLNGLVALVDQAIEAIPVLQEIPLWTATWLIIIWLDRNQKVEAVLAPVLAIEQLEGEGIENNGGVPGGPDGGLRAGGGTLQAAQVENEYQPGGAVPVPTNNETENSRPSERSTEREAENRPEENARPSEKESEKETRQKELTGEGEIDLGGNLGGSDEDQNQETEEERRKRQTQEEVAKMMETGAEVPPMETAEEEDFAVRPQESEATRQLNERAAKKREAEDRRNEEKAKEQSIQLKKLKQSPIVTAEDNEEDDVARAA